MIHEIARAYHCPQGVMAHIAYRHPGLLATIEDLGPMRMYWNREWGWMLNNVPVYMRKDKWSGQMTFSLTRFNRNGGKHSPALSLASRTEPT